MLKFGLISLTSQWDLIKILHNSKHGNIINDQKSRPSPLPNKSLHPKGTTYQVLITQIKAKGWLRKKLMKASHWFNIKYAYLQFDEMSLLLKGVILNLNKMQNERMVKIVWPKKITFNFQKGTWGMASKTPYVIDIKQWRTFLERP